MRVPPQTILRAADARPFELQDSLPSDTRFKILVFPGDVSSPGSQKERLEKLATVLCGDSGVLTRISSGSEKTLRSTGLADGAGAVLYGKAWTRVFDVVVVVSGKKEVVNFTSVPAMMVSHWSKYVFPRCNLTSKF